MTTNVTVSVPTGHSETVRVKVSTIDEYGNRIQGEVTDLKTGEKRDFYVTTNRKIVVEEIELK